MRQMGIKAQWVKPYVRTTINSDFSQKLKNILNEEFNPEHPDAVWCSDITYIWTFEGFVYLTSVMDLYSRKIVSWVLSKTLEATHVVECIEKAKKSGICISAVRYANHYGFAGYWSEMMAKEGFIGISSTNTIRGVCPTRSADRILGTNPIAGAVPTAGGEPMFLLDMATSAMPYGKISRSKVFAESGVLPEDILINAKGESITSFPEALELLAHGDTESKTPDRPTGGLVPLGGATEMHCGYKGYGLALLVELLTGGLSGGIPSKFIPYAGEGICFFFMAISPELFGERQAVIKHMKYIIEEYRKAQPISNDMPVLIPGDNERMYRNEALKSGITLSEDIVNRLRYVAQRTGKEDEFEKIFTVKE